MSLDAYPITEETKVIDGEPLSEVGDKPTYNLNPITGGFTTYDGHPLVVETDSSEVPLKFVFEKDAVFVFDYER